MTEVINWCIYKCSELCTYLQELIMSVNTSLRIKIPDRDVYMYHETDTFLSNTKDDNAFIHTLVPSAPPLSSFDSFDFKSEIIIPNIHDVPDVPVHDVPSSVHQDIQELPVVSMHLPFKMFFHSHYLDITDFYDNKKIFTTDTTYYGNTFLKNTQNQYFKVLSSAPKNQDLHIIPSRTQFIQSISKMKSGDIIVRIIIYPKTMIYVAKDNSLCLNNVSCEHVERLNLLKEFWCDIPKNHYTVYENLNQTKIK